MWQETRADDIHHAAPRGFFAPDRSAEYDWFTGDDAQFLMSDHHAVSVEHPAHHLRIRSGIGRGDVLHRPDERENFARISASESFLFSDGKRPRIANHAALGSAVGKIDEGVLPGLQHRQRHDFIAIDGDVVSNAALEGSARVVVLGAVAGEDLNAAVIHPHRAGDAEDAFGGGEDLPPDRIEIHRLVDAIEIEMGILPEF